MFAAFSFINQAIQAIAKCHLLSYAYHVFFDLCISTIQDDMVCLLLLQALFINKATSTVAEIRELDLLDHASSLKLFRSCTNQSELPDSLRKWEEKVVIACGGLPLALVIAGGQLVHEKDDGIWEVRPVTNSSKSDGRISKTFTVCK
jgi:hypothetical protein